MGSVTTSGWLLRQNSSLCAARKGKICTKEACLHTRVGANSSYLVSEGGNFA